MESMFELNVLIYSFLTGYAENNLKKFVWPWKYLFPIKLANVFHSLRGLLTFEPM